ncbi:DUF2993 domain-containing protein [Streptomyces sodiiphilus]|uniref:DUF2993 domain-containing protein n=1 Tax=Streptomyces sodiiphilus TaxID=226217 RepID=A0ABN2NS01_9ACTN
MRALRIGLILLIVLGGLFVAADRVAVRLAEGEVASKARSGLGLEREPEVSVNGFPFLTQLAGGSLDHVELRLEDYRLTVDGETATVREFALDLRDVDLGDGYSRAVAREVGGGAVLDYSEATKIINDDRVTGIAYGGDGRIDVTLRISVAGISLERSVPADLTLEGNTLQVRVIELPELPSVPGVDIEEYLNRMLDIDRELTGLPSGLELKDVSAGEDGVRLGVTGSGVSLTG